MFKLIKPAHFLIFSSLCVYQITLEESSQSSSNSINEKLSETESNDLAFTGNDFEQRNETITVDLSMYK
jgi:hypothetical protein